MTIQEQSRRTASADDPAFGDQTGDRDRKLVLAFLGGDNDAFSIIAHDHYPALSAQARRLLGPTGQAEDAVQETFERALKNIRRFGLTGEYRLGPWLGRILSNVCADHRSRSARQMRLVQAAAARPSLEADVADRVSDPRTIEFVRNALRELPQTHYRALVLHELDGLPYADVAEAENISVANARARVSRGKSSLRRSLHALRGIVFLPVIRMFTRGDGFSKLSHRAKSVASPTDQLPRSTAASSIVDQVAGRLANTPLGQGALALMASPPRGLVFGLAATVATVGASSAVLDNPASSSMVPAVASLSSDVVASPTAPVAIVPAPPAAAPRSSTASTGSPATGGTTYGWVDPNTQGSGSTGTVPVASLPAAPCMSEDGVAAPGSQFTYGAPLGMANAVSVANAPTTVLATTGTSLSFSAPLSVSSLSDTGSTSTLFNLSASACVSANGWFTASLTGTGTSGSEVSVELTGVLQEVIGSPGDLGYIFRGTVVDQGEQGAILDSSQFVAQVVLAVPANTAQLTVVFLAGSAQSGASTAPGGSGQTAAGSDPSGQAPSSTSMSSGATSAQATPTPTPASGSAQPALPPFAPLTEPVISSS